MNKLFPITNFQEVVFVWGAGRWWHLIVSKKEAKKIYGEKTCVCVAKNCVELYLWYSKEKVQWDNVG